MFNLINTNRLIASDSYKTSQFPAYPEYMDGMFAYGEARKANEIVVSAGLVYAINRYLSTPITQEEIDEAAAFIQAHGEPFNREGWEYILNTYRGYFPITIRAIPEGTPIPSRLPMFTVECTDKQAMFLVSYIETWLLRGAWYSSTIVSQGYQSKKFIKEYYEISGADMANLPFALLDFSGRGVTCGEQAQLAGMAHMYNYMGSDTMEGIATANKLFNTPMAGFSVPASEHNNAISFGEDDEEGYIKAMLDNYAKPGAVVSIVTDAYDPYRFTELVCDNFGDQIITSCATVVLRPDAGDPEEMLGWMLPRLAKRFGFTSNAKGFKKLNHVKILWGDGINSMSIRTIYGFVVAHGWAADNILLGSGGGLMQSCNRDTYAWAMKGSAKLVDGKWIGMSKRPSTDPSKRSKEGRVSTAVNAAGDHICYDIDHGLPEGFTDAMVTLYSNGTIYENPTMDEIRARMGNW